MKFLRIFFSCVTALLLAVFSLFSLRNASLVDAARCTPLGDINCDGVVNITDLGALLGAFGSTNPDLDLDNNGTVGITDLTVLLSNMGKSTSATPTPTSPITSQILHPDFMQVANSYKYEIICEKLASTDRRCFYPPQGIPVPTQQAVNLGIPECPAQMHDRTKWHPLYVPPELITPQMKSLLPSKDMSQTGCHYNHEHKANPYVVDYIFGPVGKYANNQTLSYPWQTFSLDHITSYDPNLGKGADYPPPPPTAGKMENDIKHEGYIWYVLTDELNEKDGKPFEIPCTPPSRNEQLFYNCIVAARVQFHFHPTNKDTVVRFHSLYMEVKTCEPTGQRCGIIRLGGWEDFGLLEIPYHGDGGKYIPLPGDPPSFATQSLQARSYRAHRPDASTSSMPDALWNGFLMGTRSRDQFEFTSQTNPFASLPICPENNCAYNGSTIKISNITLNTLTTQLELLQYAQNGVINFNGYTDRYVKKIQPNCTAPGLDCVPLVLENVPVHRHTNGYDYMHPFYAQDAHDAEALFMYDYDTSPASLGIGNQWWITYPTGHYDH